MSKKMGSAKLLQPTDTKSNGEECGKYGCGTHQPMRNEEYGK
jgi:hypothetical protein